jgi:hydrogenase maturation protease
VTSPAGTAEPARVLVAGVGNLFLADDGFGPEVARRLLADGGVEGARIVDYGIRGMHLAYELLDGYDVLIIIDTVPPRTSAGTLTLLEVTADDLGEGDFDAHGMDPTAVLARLGDLGGRLPRTFVIGCEPASIDEGIGLTGPVSAAIPGAVQLVRNLVGELMTPAAGR